MQLTAFSHPDYTVGTGIPPVQSCVSTGFADFNRRSGIILLLFKLPQKDLPCPENLGLKYSLAAIVSSGALAARGQNQMLAERSAVPETIFR